jgi:formylglycine-generating enzyme required for sulfatase activity
MTTQKTSLDLGLLAPLIVLASTIILGLMPATRDNIHWTVARVQNTSAGYTAYLKHWSSNGLHATEATRIGDERAWAAAKALDTIPALDEYLRRYPAGLHADTVDGRHWQEATATNTVQGYHAYLSILPQGRHVAEAKEAIDTSRWQQATATNTIKGYREYIAASPTGRFIGDANKKIDRLTAWQTKHEKEIERAQDIMKRTAIVLTPLDERFLETTTEEHKKGIEDLIFCVGVLPLTEALPLPDGNNSELVYTVGPDPNPTKGEQTWFIARYPRLVRRDIPISEFPSQTREKVLNCLKKTSMSPVIVYIVGREAPTRGDYMLDPGIPDYLCDHVYPFKGKKSSILFPYMFSPHNSIKGIREYMLNEIANANVGWRRRSVQGVVVDRQAQEVIVSASDHMPVFSLTNGQLTQKRQCDDGFKVTVKTPVTVHGSPADFLVHYEGLRLVNTESLPRNVTNDVEKIESIIGVSTKTGYKVRFEIQTPQSTEILDPTSEASFQEIARLPESLKDFLKEVRERTEAAKALTAIFAKTGTGAARQELAFQIPDMGLSMVWIEPGNFTMGSRNGDSDEQPVTQVRISRGFWLGKTEVTQSQWRRIMGTNPSSFRWDDLPVENVSWMDAVEFCRKLTERERAAGRLPEGYEYTLPTEAQWEYACRAGTTGDFAGTLDAMAWYNRNSGEKTHPVGQKTANAWDLCDMHGNVWEWCLDWNPRCSGGQATDPTGSSTMADGHVVRGGSSRTDASGCRSARRGWITPWNHDDYDPGFRLALSFGSNQGGTR